MHNLIYANSTESPHRVQKRAPHSLLLNEIKEEGQTRSNTHSRHLEDDYTDFESRPLANAGAKHELKIVTLLPMTENYENTEKNYLDFAAHRIPNVKNKLRGRPRPRISHQAQQIPVPRKYLRRVGYYFQHYPYNKLDRFYQLNPHLYYNYPPGYEHVHWHYPLHGTPYFRERQFYHLQALGPYG